MGGRGALNLSKTPGELERIELPVVPSGVYGGHGAIFAAENPIFQSKIVSLQFLRSKI